MLKQSVLAFAMWNLCGVSALAGAVPPACDETYVQTTAGDKTTSKITSDGKGIVKTVSDTAGGKIVSLIDYNAMMSTTVMYGQHMWMKTALKDPYKDEKVMKQEGKSLGTKTFDGHVCNGYETKSDNGVSQTWIGNDNHVMVHF